MGAGKTSFIRRAVRGVFQEAYKMTIGADFVRTSRSLVPSLH
jgi:GTPase SAR1 family protein